MKDRAAAILIENGKILLMHRIKNIDGKEKEYYVVPGGGIEKKETLEEATRREINEEIGIEVSLLSNKPLIILKEENITQYFTLIKRISGKIGTGKGPEFTDPSYANKGFYGVEMIKINDIINGNINMVPEIIKEEFIKIIINYDIDNLNSNDLISEKTHIVEIKKNG